MGNLVELSLALSFVYYIFALSEIGTPIYNKVTTLINKYSGKVSTSGKVARFFAKVIKCPACFTFHLLWPSCLLGFVEPISVMAVPVLSTIFLFAFTFSLSKLRRS